MARVIDLDGKKRRETKRRRDDAWKRAAAVAGALTCGLCPHRCSHCGLPIDTNVTPEADMKYPLCESCMEEYRSFKRLERGEKSRDAFWHTDKWAATWRAWLEYMRTSDEFRRSPAFIKLIEKSQS